MPVENERNSLIESLKYSSEQKDTLIASLFADIVIKDGQIAKYEDLLGRAFAKHTENEKKIVLLEGVIKDMKRDHLEEDTPMLHRSLPPARIRSFFRGKWWRS